MPTLIIFSIFAFVYITNIGQLVHHTPTPNFFERIGR